jgi:hypothetical protein
VEPRQLAYWPFRNELYVGFSNGCVSVFEVSNFENGPICNFFFNSKKDLIFMIDTAMEHSKEIRSTKFVEGLGMIVTCSDDKYTNFWMPPRSWRNEEKEEIETETKETKAKKKGDGNSSDD